MPGKDFERAASISGVTRFHSVEWDRPENGPLIPVGFPIPTLFWFLFAGIRPDRSRMKGTSRVEGTNLDGPENLNTNRLARKKERYS
jgi:hypothetical protein